MESFSFRDLLEKYLSHNISASEKRRFYKMLQEPGFEPELRNAIEGYFREFDMDEYEDLQLRDSLLQRIKEDESFQTPVIKRQPLILYPWFRYAAILFLVIGTAVFFLYNKSDNPHFSASNPVPVTTPGDILPGTNKAILTLSDGKKIALTGGNEALNDGGVHIDKSDGKLVYGSTDIVAYNTMSTPRGGQYKLVLADGTQVWLNAASSITFPTAFAGAERLVEITGEAYFDVAKDKKRPFIIKSGETQVRVLGTSFNINAYHDEITARTTLVEGQIIVKSNRAQKTVAPGQQAETLQNGNIELLNNVDVDQVVAWKNGSFSFNRTPLKEVMRQVARWYDVEILYESVIPDLKFGGELKRNLLLMDMLEILTKTGVHFRVEGKKLIVFP